MAQSTDRDTEETAFLQDQLKGYTDRRPHRQRLRYVLWFATLINAFSVLIHLMLWQANQPRLTWPTDLPDAASAIYYEERTFTGELVWDYTLGRATRLPDPKMEFFGPPSQAISHAWDTLLHDEFVVMTDKEVTALGQDYQPLPNLDHGKVYFEPAVFHALHCVNHVRKRLETALYNTTDRNYKAEQDHLANITNDPKWDVTHIEHCLDLLRQTVMCQGDLSPVPLYPVTGIPLSLGKSGIHSCRKWEPIRAWMDRRATPRGALR